MLQNLKAIHSFYWECALRIRYAHIILTGLLLLSTAGWAQFSPLPAPKEVTELIQETGRAFVPERRLQVFNVKAEMQNDTLIVQGETTVAAARDSLLSRLARLRIEPNRIQIVTLPLASLGEKTQGVITVSTAPLRKGPDVDYEMINQGILGEAVTILRHAGMFWYIQLSDGYVGYMMNSSIAVMDKQQFAEWQARPKVIFRENFGQVYSEKKTNSYPVCDLTEGLVLARDKKEGKWWRVMLPDGRSGYVLKSQVRPLEEHLAQPKPTGKQLVHTARCFTGHPYLWGGLTTKGFDCSGFTKAIYRHYGITLPRDANMQVLAGEPVAMDSTYSQLQPGDLLFFGRSLQRITHVGMYIGDKKFIHSDGWVHINSFNPADAEFSAYRVKGLQAVRRFL